MIPTVNPNYGTLVQSDGRRFLAQLEYNGTPLTCDIASLTVNKGSCGSIEGFTSGAVISSVLTAEVKNLTTVVRGGEITAKIGLLTGENPDTYEYVQLGKFTVSTAEKTLYSTIITAYGATVSKTNKPFTSPQDLTPPQTLSISNIVSEIVSELQADYPTLTVSVDAGIDGSTVLTYPMSGLTIYQALQAVAGVVGGYVVDTYDGNIAIRLYHETPTLTVYARLMKLLPVVEESDYDITGVACVTPAGVIASTGTINLATECTWVDATNFAQHANNLIGYTYRPATIDLTLGDPRIEGDDVLTVTDADGSTYIVPCHEVVHSYTGGFSTYIRSAVASQIENDIATAAPLTTQVNDAKQMAQEAYDLASQAGDTSQYFWHTTTDTGAGAGSHITEIPQAEFLQKVAVDPTDGGGNTLINSSGMAIRQGLTELAKFEQTTEGSQSVSKLTLGTSNGNIQSHVEMNYQGMKAVDKGGNVFFDVRDARNVDGVVPWVDSFTKADDEKEVVGMGYYYDLSYEPIQASIEVYKDGSSTPSTDYQYWDSTTQQGWTGYSIFFATGDQPSTSLIVKYNSSTPKTKAFKFGTRPSSDPFANYSATFGAQCTATGQYSFAQGYYTKATGNYSFADGYYSEARGSMSHAVGRRTVAYAPYQFVCGVSNEIGSSSDDLRFIVGGGNAAGTTRKNVFTVDNGGTVEALGSITAKGGGVIQNGLECTGDLTLGGDILSNAYVDNPTANSNIGAKNGGSIAIYLTARTDGSIALVDYRTGAIKWIIYSPSGGSDIYIGGNASTGINMNPSQTANTVLAAPNGSDGKPTWRTLVAADIPNHSAAKITSGTLGVARLPNMLQTKAYSYTKSTSTASGASVAITGTNFSVSTPSNYVPVGIAYFATSNSNILVRGANATVTGSSSMMYVTNVSSSAVSSFTAYITILYAYTGTVA